LLLLAAANCPATVRYVSVNSPNPTAPYTSWATAARTIQAAVDAASSGDIVLVTNGVYQTGGLYYPPGGQSNRVSITKPVAVQSVNGADKTAIVGLYDARCVYMESGASLSGFTLTNGYAVGDFGGGAYGGVLSNCVLVANGSWYGTGGGGGAASNTLYNCVLTGNSAAEVDGSAAFACILNNCTITNNGYYSSYTSGGVVDCVLNNCLIGKNGGLYDDTGILDSSLTNCTIVNSESIVDCLLTNCTGQAQSSVYAGGCSVRNCTFNNFIADFSSVANSVIMGRLMQSTGWNSVITGSDGIPADSCALTNCTVAGNKYGVTNCALYNCIVYYNGKGSNYDASSILRYCCTTPLPPGPGNITSEPQLVDQAHIAVSSPCRGAGNVAYARGLDIDLESWATPPSIGCDEYHAGPITGLLSVAICAQYTNGTAGFPVNFSAQITGRATSNYWEFGDGTSLTNRAAGVSHAWTSNGVYTVRFHVYNDSKPLGVSASVAVNVVANPVQYVSLASTNPVSPYLSWATAATNIQDAVDAGFPGGTIFVSNGVYRAARDWTVLNVPAARSIQSVNGPAVTVIDGSQTNRCASLVVGVTMSGFTFANSYNGVFCNDDGAVSQSVVLSNCIVRANGDGIDGGTVRNSVLAQNSVGASGSVLVSCVLSSNNPPDSPNYYSSGGAIGCTLSNCTLAGNGCAGAVQSTLDNCVLSGNFGDGARNCTLRNCALTGNSGSGASRSTLTNCTVTLNQTGIQADDYNSSYAYNCLVYHNTQNNYAGFYILNFCCTEPLPYNGSNNITSEPRLTDSIHIGSTSPCISAGSAAYARGLDIDGEAWASPPSIGCDQFRPGAVSGPLAVSLTADHTNVATGFVVNFTPQVNGHASFSFLDFDDGTFLFDHPFAVSHAFTAPGDYDVMVVAYNDSFPDGVIATVMIHVLEDPVQYVAFSNSNPKAPYTSWATAATNIQDAVDQAFQGGSILVSNGVYQTGSRWAGPYYYQNQTNRLFVTTPVPIRSLNGPLVTTIDGGGAMWCALLTNGASLTGFTLRNGVGGVAGGAVSNCIMVANQSYGANNATLVNCALVNNQGYGAYGGLLRNCTAIGNGIGALAPMDNCIAYFNRTNYAVYSYGYGERMNFCCTTPLAVYGDTNITAEPQLTDSLHLAAGSPCRGAAPAGSSAGADIDGEPWLATPAIGCDEFYSGAAGPLTILASAEYTNVAVGFPVNFSAAILGHAFSNRWDFGDGTLVNNQLFQPFTSHTWSTPGDYSAVLRAYNATYPAGISATVTVHVVSQPIHYVSLASPNPVAPFASWATAATNVQQAVNVASVPGALVLVSNGVYQTGAQLAPGSDSASNRITVLKPLIVQSLNGPAVTHIKGDSQTRCAYLTNNAWLIGFTLTNGTAPSSYYVNYYVGGGGVAGGSVSNCTLTGNSTSGNSMYGGGAYGATLYNCRLTNNASSQDGGGAYACTLFGCTLVTNRAGGGGPGGTGGGAHSSFLINCVLSNNVAASGGGAYASILTNCVLTRNRAANSGGGAAGQNIYYLGTPTTVLLGCTLVSNSATSGGGAYGCGITNCLLSRNSAYQGGGSYDSILDACVFASNSASSSGGGDSKSWLFNCTLTNNTAPNGGGVDDSAVYGSFLARNFATNNGGAAYGYASLYNCTVSDNTAGQKGGGGAAGPSFVNCALTGNFATQGGGASQCDLYDCVLTDNSASDSGGGIHGCTVRNCTLVENVANNFGGGAYDCYLVSSIIYYNSASDFSNVFPNLNPDFGPPDHCCTTPMPTNGVWCITNQPAFVNLASNYRLQTNSPCINAGNNASVNQSTPDLDGNPRVAGGTVDIGAYEYQNPSSTISYAWLQQYGLAMDGSADHADADGDHLDNWSEWRAGTSPLDATSLLRFSNISVVTNAPDPTPLIHLEWQAVPGVAYFLEAASSVTGPFTNIVNYIPADSTKMIWESAINLTEPSKFYKVGVE
jgi:PKD repeat protein